MIMNKVRFVGLDVHTETLVVAVAEADGDVHSLGMVPNRPESIRRLVRNLGVVHKYYVRPVGSGRARIPPGQRIAKPVLRRYWFMPRHRPSWSSTVRVVYLSGWSIISVSQSKSKTTIRPLGRVTRTISMSARSGIGEVLQQAFAAAQANVPSGKGSACTLPTSKVMGDMEFLGASSGLREHDLSHCLASAAATLAAHAQ